MYIFALAATGQGISGSDRIFIEFARHWSDDYPVEIFVWEEGYKMCQRQGLNVSSIKYQVSSMNPWKYLGFVVNYIARIIEGIRVGLTLKLDDSPNTIIYSASEFWMDCLPAVILKIKYPKIKWVAGWYQTAPKPWIGYTEGERVNKYNLSAFLYWVVQQPIKPLISHFADFVLVNNEDERKEFPDMDKNGKVIVVLGAVDIKKIGNWKLEMSKARAGALGNLPKVYDAVFQGRFHPQKGVVELIDIWKMIVKERPDAKLVMIGDGPLMKNVKFQISNLKLDKNIILAGYLFDGEEKYRIFAQSKIVVHPAFYDSGGMAAGEAMAFGLPCVGFNLSSYKYYYPKGMEKVKVGDLDSFADKILQLLSQESLYKKMSKEAKQLINYKWSWEYRSLEILNQVIK